MDIKALLQRHPIVSYFVLAYGITWSGIFAIMAAIQFQTSEVGIGMLVLIFLAMLLGPSLAGISLTSLMEGRQGIRELFLRMRNWQIGLAWYGVAIFTEPVVLIIILFALSWTVSPVFRPGWMPVGLVFGALAGFFEEIGWTGFALPRLQKKYGGLGGGLLLGVLWAFWHMAADFVGNIHTMQETWFLNFFVYWIVPLIAYRILMTWVYQNTRSLLLAQIMHMFHSGTLGLLSPANATLADGLVWKPVFAVGLWIIVAIVIAIFWMDIKRPSVSEGIAA